MKRQLLTLRLLLNLQAIFLVVLIVRCYFFLFPVKRRKANSLLILESLPVENAGYQYRAAKWKPYFEKANWQFEIWTIIEDKASYDTLTSPENISRYLVYSMWLRLRQILRSRHHARVIVRRELLQYNDYGDCFMEKLLQTIHPSVVLDIDDNIAEAKREPRQITSWFGKINREDGLKFTNSLLHYHSFIVGTPFLKEFVLSIRPSLAHPNFCFVPTCVDYDQYQAKEYNNFKTPVRIGWIGGIGNLPYLEIVVPALNLLASRYPIELHVLSGQDFVSTQAVHFPIVNEKWTLASEIDTLKKWDIGLMPLPNSKLATGKSGFKLLQYMGLGLVAAASDVGINNEIISDKENAYLVKGQDDWYAVLLSIIEAHESWSSIGRNARSTVDSTYTFTANAARYVDFIERL